MADIWKVILFIVIGLIVVELIRINWHGYYQECSNGSLHENCDICDMYRILHMNDAEFQLRELNQAAKRN